MAYPLEEQEMGLWCWAAVAHSVEKYFNPATQWTQCTVASAVKKHDCCANKQACNSADDLHAALKKVGRYRNMFAGHLSFAEIKDFLRAGYPVGVRIDWGDQSAHFIVISGCKSQSGVKLVFVEDPKYGPDCYEYDDLVKAYLGCGQWSHTYLVEE